MDLGSESVKCRRRPHCAAGVPIMDVYEQVAKDRIDAALREAEQRRAIRAGRVRGSRLVRLRSVLARLGQRPRRWIFKPG